MIIIGEDAIVTQADFCLRTIFYHLRETNECNNLFSEFLTREWNLGKLILLPEDHSSRTLRMLGLVEDCSTNTN